MAPDQQITFLTDGGEDIRDLPRFLNPQAERLLDWFHITMRLTVMSTMTNGLRGPPPDPDELLPAAQCDLATEVGKDLESLTWFLGTATSSAPRRPPRTLSASSTTSVAAKPLSNRSDWSRRCVSSTPTSGPTQTGSPTTGNAHRAGETISSSFVESAVNQVISNAC